MDLNLQPEGLPAKREDIAEKRDRAVAQIVHQDGRYDFEQCCPGGTSKSAEARAL